MSNFKLPSQQQCSTLKTIDTKEAEMPVYLTNKNMDWSITSQIGRKDRGVKGTYESYRFQALYLTSLLL